MFYHKLLTEMNSLLANRPTHLSRQQISTLLQTQNSSSSLNKGKQEALQVHSILGLVRPRCTKTLPGPHKLDTLLT